MPVLSHNSRLLFSCGMIAMIRFVTLLFIGLGVSLLSACGQKGPLYFPPADAKPYTAPERSAPPEFPEAPEKPAAISDSIEPSAPASTGDNTKPNGTAQPAP